MSSASGNRSSSIDGAGASSPAVKSSTDTVSTPQQQQLHDASTSSLPFFADATLDLDTAHDLAETPEATRPMISSLTGSGGGGSRGGFPPMVPLTEDSDGRRPPSPPNFMMDMPTLGDGAELIDDDESPYEESQKTSFTRITAQLEPSATPPTTSRQSLPKWPRDLPWAAGFLLVVPFGLIWPIVSMKKHAAAEDGEDGDANNVSPLVRPPLSSATLHALFWAAMSSFFASRFFYRTAPSGPEGDAQRHQICQVLVGSTALSVAVYTCLVCAVWAWLPNCRWMAALPLWFDLNQIFLLRAWRHRGDRQAFFQALANMALDILSKSLRRASFFRVLSALLMVQTAVLFLWRLALLGALSNRSGLQFTLAVIAGKWATGTVARLLSFLASGGVLSWFVEQQAALPENVANESPSRSEDAYDYSQGANDDMPDAYRTVDASVYQSVMEVDDTLDDDDEYDEDDAFESSTSQQRGGAASGSHKVKSTVKSLLTAGLTISFGSVVQCGLLGGLAQFVWSQLRKIDAAQSVWARLREQQQRGGRGAGGGGFSSMQIGAASSSSATNSGLLKKLWIQWLGACRQFVRSHSDLSMSHVAAYSKNYIRASKDVAQSIDQSGVEPILHQDITTHMCTAVGGSAAGIIVLFTGYVLLEERRHHHATSTDVHVLQNMILAFVLCYTLIFTVTEPLRASIKAVYVSFAQHPQSLSQAYPLIYQRLRRLSQSNQTITNNNTRPAGMT